MICDSYVQEVDLVNCGCDTGELTALTVAELLLGASDWMYQMTGSRYPGTCEVTERPCGCGCGCGLYSTMWANMNGLGSPGGCCSGLCGCSAEAKIALTYGPVQTATVSIFGVSFTDFAIVEPNLLVRTDGNQWPSCQTYQGTDGWSVTYTYGVEPPILVKLAAQDLAIELVKACPGGPGGECKLPGNTIAVNRRGVSLTLDPAQVGNALPRVALALSAFGRKGQADLVIPGRRGLVTAGPSGS